MKLMLLLLNKRVKRISSERVSESMLDIPTFDASTTNNVTIRNNDNHSLILENNANNSLSSRNKNVSFLNFIIVFRLELVLKKSSKHLIIKLYKNPNS